MSLYNTLLQDIIHKSARIGTVGIGYVGRAVGEGAAYAGYPVVGFGRTKSSVDKINQLNIPGFSATNKFEELASCQIICICVPTPVHEDKTPDLEPLIDATTRVAKILKKGHLVIIESSIAPGTTRTEALPILEKTGLTVERDYFLAFSPERIDPGNPNYSFRNIPKVVAGYGELSANLAYEFYKNVVVETHLVSSLEVAEMSKILENTFRLVNISLINEIAQYTRKIGIDIWEVIDAAKTKPFGFMAHYPSPGIGGHCIPVDPHYLRMDAQRLGIDLTLVAQAGKINDMQPDIVVNKAMNIVSETNGIKEDHHALIVGITYKPDVPDLRESSALTIWKKFEENGYTVDYHDPYIETYGSKKSIFLTPDALKKYDIVVIVTNHSVVDYNQLKSDSHAILDTRNVYPRSANGNLYRL